MDDDEAHPALQKVNQKEFLERTPPGTTVRVPDFEAADRQGNQHIAMPEIELHCDVCKGTRFYAGSGESDYIEEKKPHDAFLNYFCRNCEKSFKTFAVGCIYDADADEWLAYKYGEEPAYGPPTPARAISLIGPDREQFLKGRRCENQGLGVGAFVYYRRVVENQKNRIFDEIIRVSQHLGADPLLIAEIEAAKKEVQFTKAVEAIKHGLPQSLLVNGHNPLTLLHSALSEGVHALADAECLQLASSVRIVLIEFAERLSQAMKDEAELNEAVNKLATKGKK